MTRRSLVAAPGGFTHSVAVASGFEVEDIACAFCGRHDEPRQASFASAIGQVLGVR